MFKQSKFFLIFFYLSPAMIVQAMEERFVNSNADIAPFFQNECGSYRCSECNEFFVRSSNFRKHMSMKHNKLFEPLNKISKPQKNNTSEGSLYATKSRKLSKYHCYYCKEKFLSLAVLRNHVTDKHNGTIETLKRKISEESIEKDQASNSFAEILPGVSDTSVRMPLADISGNSLQSMEPAQKKMRTVEYNEFNSFFDLNDQEQIESSDSTHPTNMLDPMDQEKDLENSRESAEMMYEDTLWDIENFLDDCIGTDDLSNNVAQADILLENFNEMNVAPSVCNIAYDENQIIQSLAAFQQNSSNNEVEKENDKKRYHCDQCGKSYSRQGNLSHHKNVKHSEVSKIPHSCLICQKVLKNAHTLSIHKEYVHKVCNTCGEQCDSAEALKKHKKDHRKVLNTCSVCNSVFSNKKDLKEHFKEEHRTAYHCPQCLYKCFGKNALTRHIVSQHPILFCDICNERFDSLIGFKNHKRTTCRRAMHN